MGGAYQRDSPETRRMSPYPKCIKEWRLQHVAGIKRGFEVKEKKKGKKRRVSLYRASVFQVAPWGMWLQRQVFPLVFFFCCRLWIMQDALFSPQTGAEGKRSQNHKPKSLKHKRKIQCKKIRKKCPHSILFNLIHLNIRSGLPRLQNQPGS